MARQKGLILLSGKIGNLVFSILNGKGYVKNAAAPYTQPENSQKSGSDLGTASKARSLIRMGFEQPMDAISDERMDKRLQQRLIKLVNTGPKALQGRRQITDGDVALLKGFEFNVHTPIHHLVLFSPTIVIEPTGEVVVSIPKMRIKDMFNAPRKARKVILQFCCCAFYFDIQNGRMSKPEDLVVSLNKERFPGGHFRLPMEDTRNCVLAMAWGICFTLDDHQAVSFDQRYYAGNILEAVNIVDGEIITFQYPEPPAPEKPDDQQPRAQWVMNEEE